MLATKSQRATMWSIPTCDFVARAFVACYTVARWCGQALSLGNSGLALADIGLGLK